MSGIIDRIKCTAEDKAQILRDMVHNQTALKYAPDWMAETERITGQPCTSWDQIAWDDPEIRLQYWLCDPVHLKHIKSKKHRAAALATLTDEQLKIYYEVRDGHSYSDLEKGAWKTEITKVVMSRKRKS